MNARKLNGCLRKLNGCLRKLNGCLLWLFALKDSHAESEKGAK